MFDMINVLAIDEHSPHFPEVIALGKKENKTLGFMPEGGFLDHAREKHIGAAVLDGKCAGYLMYRVVGERATIVHFCVAHHARRQGVARAMMRWLIDRTKHLCGIRLSCRVDFEATKMWLRLGFHPTRTVRGKAGDVTVWCQSHGHRDLFTEVEPAGIQAVVDLNVFIDLVDGSSEETYALREDWLLPFVTLCCTAEHSIELDRQEDVEVKSRRKRELDQFKLIEGSAEEFQLAEQKLRPLFAMPMSENDESDFRQLVRASAVFDTIDEAERLHGHSKGSGVLDTHRDSSREILNSEVARGYALARIPLRKLVNAGLLGFIERHGLHRSLSWLSGLRFPFESLLRPDSKAPTARTYLAKAGKLLTQCQWLATAEAIRTGCVARCLF